MKNLTSTAKPKYNLSLIMKFTWKSFRSQSINTSEQFSICLKQAWHLAKTNPAQLEPMDFSALYIQYHTEFLNFINYKTRNRVVSEELANDIFIKAIKYQNKYDSSKCKIRTWLYMIAITAMKDYWRKQKRSLEISVADFTTEEGKEIYQFVSANDTSNIIESEELNNCVMKIIYKLKPNYQQVAKLYFLEQLQYNEIAEVLDIPMGSVKGMINRIREKLQNGLKVAKKEYAIC